MSKPFTTLEQFLGRRLDESARGSVATLNDLDAEMEREVRELATRSRLAAAVYLEYHVRVADKDYIASFINEALLSKKEPVQTWGRSDVLCHPEFKLEDLLTMSIHDILEPVRLQEGSKWYRTVPTRRDWHCISGAPGSLVRDAPYWWEPTSDQCDALFFDRELDLVEPITDLDVATRRWIASRVARSLRRDPAPIRSIDDVCQRLQIDQASLSEDAALAIRGLVCSLPVDDPDVPGFTGPDSAFMTQT